MKIKEMMDKVERYLENYPHLRDDDNKLLASVWKMELGIDAYSKITGFDFLKLVSEGKVSNPQSITRARRKLQELRPDLRGKKYLERMAKAFEVKTTITKM